MVPYRLCPVGLGLDHCRSYPCLQQPSRFDRKKPLNYNLRVVPAMLTIISPGRALRKLVYLYVFPIEYLRETTSC